LPGYGITFCHDTQGWYLMEYFSPVYELFHRCEKKGMRLNGSDIMLEADILNACTTYLQNKGVIPDGYRSGTASSN